MTRLMRRLAAPLAAMLSAALIVTGLPSLAGGGERLRLIGTVMAPGRSAAVFEEPTGAQVLRRVGDPVGSGLRLAAVRRGAADLISADGGRVTLRLRQAAAAPTAAAAATRPRDSTPAAAAGHVGGALREAGGEDDAAAPASLLTDRPRMPPVARLVPVSAGGRLAGVRLIGGPPDSPLVRAGLEPGDLLVAIDGRTLEGSGAEALGSVARALESASAEARPLVIDARREALVLRVEIPHGEPAP